jgi:hypothetical protein
MKTAAGITAGTSVVVAFPPDSLMTTGSPEPDTGVKVRQPPHQKAGLKHLEKANSANQIAGLARADG